MGNEDLYKLVVAEYPASLTRAIEKLRHAHSKNDATALRECALLLQGSASYVAADRLHAHTAALVDRLDSLKSSGMNSTDTDALQTHLHAVSKEAQALCVEIAGIKGVGTKQQQKGPPQSMGKVGDSEESSLLAEEKKMSGAASSVPAATSSKAEAPAKKCCGIQ